MENASKALLMAAGILIALLVVGALMLMFGDLSTYQRSKDTSRLNSQIAEFNNQFIPYEKDNLTLMEIKTLYNKFNNYNIDSNIRKHNNNIWKGVVYDESGKQYNLNYKLNTPFDRISETSKINRKFKCIEVAYDEEGRVERMDFEEYSYPESVVISMQQ